MDLAQRSRILLVTAALLTLAGAGCSPEKPMDAGLSGLIGPIGDEHVVLYYGSEIMGSLEGCGCMGNPRLGGLPYRMGLIRALERENPEVGSIIVDAGFTSRLITNRAGTVLTEIEAELEASYGALEESGFAAVNVSAHDVLAARRFLRVDSVDSRFAGMLVSANVEPLTVEYRAPAPFVVREVMRSGGRETVKVALVGVTDYPDSLDPSSGFRVTNIPNALERAIGEARVQADLVVVMAYVPAVVAVALLEKLVAKPDVLVVASSFGAGSADGSVMGQGLEPRLDGPTKVVYAWYKTQKLGVLRLKLDDRNRVVSATNTYVKLEAPIVPDEASERMVARQKEVVRAAKQARYRAEGVQVSNSGP